MFLNLIVAASAPFIFTHHKVTVVDPSPPPQVGRPDHCKGNVEFVDGAFECEDGTHWRRAGAGEWQRVD